MRVARVRVVSTVFSPDGTTLAVSGSEGNVSLWDVATGVRIGSPLQISLQSKPDEPLWTALELLSRRKADSDDNG